MSNVLRLGLTLALVGVLVPPLAAADNVSGNLVSARWLEQNLKDPSVLILDASSGQAYAAGHIPGAISVDFLTYGFPEPSTADMERRYQSWGVSPGRKIVMYDQGGTFMATRLFFALYYHGFPVNDLLVVDGGLAKWKELGLPLTKEPASAPAKGSFTITKINEAVRVRLPEFLAASGDPANHALLEALGPDWHYGQTVAFNRAGHVPNATLLPSADFFNPDKTFKSADDLRRMVTFLGIRPEQTVHSHCGGGVAASVPFFALKFLLNYPNVKLYVESQMGYLSDPRELPFWTYDAPFLMRQSPWLQTWGGQRMRAFGASQITVVDVRPAAAFGEGHVPFALNIPGEVFRSHLASPGKLAEILGQAGVDPAHEAVVVSGAGITPESALAFVMLERLGQQKVSLFTDSLDTWAKLGYSVTKETTVVGPKKGPQDLSIPPMPYAAPAREDVIIGDPMTSRGAYPKVFVASGKAPLTKPLEGAVVHVPYTELLNADGTPKAAKDIWNILTKAGVPRYAEIVCVADDPGDAAVNYFLLKLMGYPDVKVLMN